MAAANMLAPAEPQPVQILISRHAHWHEPSIKPHVSLWLKVYHGSKSWWREDDETSPINDYGLSKRDAELLIQVCQCLPACML